MSQPSRPPVPRVPALAAVVLLFALLAIPTALLISANAAAWLLSAELGLLAIGRLTQSEQRIAPFGTRSRLLDVLLMAGASLALAYLGLNVPTM